MISGVLMLATAPAATATVALAFDEALSRAAERPAIRTLEAALAEKRELDARLPGAAGNPEVELSPGLRFGGPADRNFEPEVGVGLPINFGGLAGARRMAASAETRALEAERRATAHTARASAARAWIELWSAEQGLVLARRELEIARELTRLAGEAEAHGAGTRSDRLEAEAYEAEVELRVVRQVGLRFERGRHLAALTGLGAAIEPATTGGLPRPRLAEGDAWRVAFDRITALPELSVLVEDRDAERAHAAELGAAVGPTAAVGVTVSRDAPDSALGRLNLRVTLPTLDRAERERGAALARARRIEATFDARKAEAEQALALAFHEVEHTREEEAVLATKLVPAMQALGEAKTRELRAGVTTWPELLRVRRAAVAVERDLFVASAARAEAEVQAALVLEALDLGGAL